MSQLPFCSMFDSAEEATSAAIVRSGKEFKEVAHAIFPALNPASAYARLKAALNPEKPEKLTADEHLLIANFCNEYDYLYYCASKCHHSTPQPVAAGDEQAELMRRFVAAVEDQKRLAARLEEVNARAQRLRAAS
jgi:hypothetical protein